MSIQQCFNKSQQCATFVDQQKLNDVEPCISRFILARRMTIISAAKIIYIHNKLIKSQSPPKATHFSGQLLQLRDIFRFFDFLFDSVLWRIAYGSSFVFVQSKRRLLHKRFTRRKCFCYVIQRQTTFSLHNNPPSQGNCKLLCHNN